MRELGTKKKDAKDKKGRNQHDERKKNEGQDFLGIQERTPSI